MQLSEVMRTTAALRSFQPAAVNDEELYAVLDDARFAPSGGNRQPWRVVVVKNHSLRASLAEAYALGWREYMAHVRAGLTPFAPGEDGVWQGPAVDLATARETPSPNAFADSLESLPVMLVVLAHLPSLAILDNGLGRQSIVGGGSVYPFTHNILLAARDRGLGGVITTVICRQEQTVKKLLEVPSGYAVAAMMALGRPVRQPSRLRRMHVEQFTTIDTMSGHSLSRGV
jgi:nitroreductase